MREVNRRTGRNRKRDFSAIAFTWFEDKGSVWSVVLNANVPLSRDAMFKTPATIATPPTKSQPSWRVIITDITGNHMLTTATFELANELAMIATINDCFTHRVSPTAFHIKPDKVKPLAQALTAAGFPPVIR